MVSNLPKNIRAYLLWSADFLTGSRIRENYRDIKFLLNNYMTEEATRRRDEYLKAILGHASSSTMFYRNFTNGMNLCEYPVVNKSVIRDNYDSFISGRFDKKRLFATTTSGSTGTPFKVYKDRGKIARHQAENIYFSQLAGYDPGTRLYYLRVWNSINRKSKFKGWAENVIMQDADDISEEKMSLFFKRLEKDKSRKSLLSFSSTCEGIVRYLEKSDYDPGNLNVTSIITISEALPDKTREILKTAFKCPVISRYSNIENGFIAQQCRDESHEYHINSASFHIELLDLNNDRPVKEGEIGRIVVTDYFNYAMPMIRYDTGDIAVMSSVSQCGLKTPVFTRIEGRQVDFIYDTSGNLLSPHVVTNTMWKYPVKQFQFIQEGEKRYRMRLNCENSIPADELSMISDLKKYLGNDADILIEYVYGIPLLSSGKRKKIINIYKSLDGKLSTAR